ncbi:MAG: apolipoprotein N-acyltransferase [Phycisphaerales bacterium]|nr:apolipoprotein N-acyltransferase [Phycisphaerales bacterium]
MTQRQAQPSNEQSQSGAQPTSWCESRPRLRALVLGLISSVLMIASYPPIGLWGCAFLVPVPMFILAMRPVIRPSRAGLYATLGMMPAWGWLHQWIMEVSAVGVFPLVLYLSVYTLLFVWLGNRLIRRWGCPAVVLPIAWVALEFVRGSLIWTGYPWYLSAHPLIDAFDGLLAAPASIGGVYMVSFLLALVAAQIAQFIVNKEAPRWRTATQAVVVLVIWATLGWFTLDDSMDNSGSQTLRVGVVQPNVPQDNRQNWTVRQRVRDWMMLRELSYRVARMDPPPDVIVWPEGFVPGWTLDPASLETERNASVGWNLKMKGPDDVPDLDMPSMISATMLVDEMLLFQEALSIPMIVGSVAYDNLQIIREGGIEYKNDAMYNSAFLIANGKPDPVWYNKMHLTPFGEVMPYISSWPWLESKLLGFGAEGMTFALEPGTDPTLLQVPTSTAMHAVATPICFEATLSGVCRKLVFDNGKRRTGLMVNITNDGWFNTWTAGRKTHELMARWRCVELATPMVRCANTGISGVIDPRGQIVAVDFFVTPGTESTNQDRFEGGFVATIELATGSTAYARIGDGLGWLVLALGLVGGFLVKKPARAGANAQESDTMTESQNTEHA